MITSLYAGILALIYVVLSAFAIRARIRNRVLFGDGGNPEVARTIRIHGNFAEYAPLSLLLMGLYEMQAGSLYVVHAIGCVLVVARILHIIGLRNDVMPARVAGTALTLGLLAILGVMLILKGIETMQVV
jgi:uncharacterized membrane protein YecN with MAPEG domain